MKTLTDVLNVFTTPGGEVCLALLLALLLGAVVNWRWDQTIQKGLGSLAKKIQLFIQRKQGGSRGGLLFLALFSLGVGFVAFLLPFLAEWLLPGWGAFILRVLLLALTLSPGQLLRMGLTVRSRLRKDDVEGSRALLAKWTQQDTGKMTAKGLYRLACELLVKNTLYTLLVPLFWWNFGNAFSMAGSGVLLVWFYMGAVGAEHFGSTDSPATGRRWSLVFYLGFLPAQIFAALLLLSALVTGKNARSAYLLLLQDGQKASDRSVGALLAALAGALGLRFGGGVYFNGVWQPALEIGFDVNRPDEKALLSTMLLLGLAFLFFLLLAVFLGRWLSTLSVLVSLALMVMRVRSLRGR